MTVEDLEQEIEHEATHRNVEAVQGLLTVLNMRRHVMHEHQGRNECPCEYCVLYREIMHTREFRKALEHRDYFSDDRLQILRWADRKLQQLHIQRRKLLML